jgi:outer membrane protein assembly factor BamB
VASFGNPPVSWSEEENIAWINRDEISSWTSPFVIEHGGSAQVVTSATNRVRSYDVETGELLWEASGVSLNAIPTPVGAQGMVFVTSGFQDFVLHAVDFPAARGDITDSNAIVWSHDRDTPYVPSPLLYDDTLYLLKSHSGILSAIEAKTGKTHYIERLDGILNVFASPVAAAGRIYIHRGRRKRPGVQAGRCQRARRRLRRVAGRGGRRDLSPRETLPVSHLVGIVRQGANGNDRGPPAFAESFGWSAEVSWSRDGRRRTRH